MLQRQYLTAERASDVAYPRPVWHTCKVNIDIEGTGVKHAVVRVRWQKQHVPLLQLGFEPGECAVHLLKCPQIRRRRHT